MSALTVDGRELADGLRQVLPAVGADKKRPALHGVLIEAADGIVRLVATDALRLAVRELSTATGSPAFRALVGGAAVAELVDWLGTSREVTVSVDDSCVVLAIGDDERSLPTIQLEYPDIGPFLAAAPDPHRIVLRRVALIDLLERLPDAPFARLGFGEGTLTITAEETSETMDALYDGAAVEVALNPDFLRDAARAFADADVAVEATTPKSPIVMTSAAAGPLTYLVMPVRTR